MKALKKILVFLIVVIALLVVVSFFLPSNIHVERSVDVKKSRAVVFEQVNTLKNWESWSPWAEEDSTMVSTYSGEESGVGARSDWNSPKMDSGYHIITEVVPDEHIKFDLYFAGEEDPGHHEWSFEEDSTGSNTKVTWSMDTDIGMMPWNKYIGLMIKSMVGKSYEKGLANLKKVAEEMPEAPAVPVEVKVDVAEKEIKGVWVVAISSTVETDSEKVKQKTEELFGKITAFMEKNGLESTGPPMAVWKLWDNDKKTAEVEAAIPINKEAEGEGDIQVKKTYEGRVVYAIHRGGYKSSDPVWTGLQEYIGENSKEVNGDACEIYLTGPSTESDTSKWETEIFYPIKG